MSDDQDHWSKEDREWDELQEAWKAVRPPPIIQVVSNRPSDLLSQLTLVAAETTFELKKVFKKYDGQSLTSDLLAEVASKGVEVFMRRWFQHLKSHDLAGLIEIVLDGQQLSPNEMKGFLQALPDSLVQRIIDSSVGTVTGVHALMAFESHRRERHITDYTLTKEGERTKIEFFDPIHRVPVSFYLDEAVKGIPSRDAR